MPDEFGPFSVNPDHLTGLGGAIFQELVSRLLASEDSAAGLSQVTLRTSHDTNKKDGGVDARTTINSATDWIPAGDCAWQFKAGTLGPEGCASELEGAAFAREIVKAGGTYRLVLGKRLEANEIEDREAKLRDKAEELGFDTSGDRFRIIDGKPDGPLDRALPGPRGLAGHRVNRTRGDRLRVLDSQGQAPLHLGSVRRSR